MAWIMASTVACLGIASTSLYVNHDLRNNATTFHPVEARAEDASMSAQVASNAWGRIVHHRSENILELAWLPTTGSMGDGGFKATLALFAWEAEKLRPASLLID